jgi:thiol-disulfide isomerase/thioredoxin
MLQALTRAIIRIAAKFPSPAALVLTGMGLAAAAAQASAPAGGTRTLAFGPAQTVAQGPFQVSPPAVRFHPAGAIQVAWFEKHQEARALRTVRIGEDDRPIGPAVQVNPPGVVPDALHQAPGLAIGSKGEVFVTWATPKTIPGAMFAADLVLARSLDGGATFESPVTVNDDGQPINHTFEHVQAGANGEVYLAWLDNRGKEKSGAGALFACSRDGGRTVGKNLVLDGMACPCCRPSAELAPDGSLWVAWRKTFEGNVRDIVLARSTDQGRTFSTPKLVHRDGWAFPACPHRGPSLAFDRAGRLYLGWYTEGTDEQPRLLFVVSDDQGKTFSTPLSLHASGTSLPDQLRMAVHPDGFVVAVWEEVTGVRKRAVMRVSTDRGKSFGPVQALSEGAKAETPTVAIHENGAVAVSWTEHAWPNNRIVLRRGRVAQAQAGGPPEADLYKAAGVQRVSGQGQAPPFLALKTLNGTELDPASVQGKVVVVNFWATWCGPCKEEMPSLQRLQQAFSPDEVVVLAITTDQQAEAMNAFARNLGLSFPILLDESKEVSAAFGVRGLPTTVILGPDGRAVGRAVGPRQWDGTQVVALLKGLLP